MERIEAVSVCVGYSDFLNETARYNRKHFRKWVIVTRPSDEETLKVCHRWNLQCVQTDVFDRADNGRFNKGAGISRGMSLLSTESWILHLDADVVLPPLFGEMLEHAHLRKGAIHGADRINIHSWEEWQKFQKENGLDNQHGWQMVCNFPQGYSIGTRIVRELDGYVPIGFFQLFWGGDGMYRNWRFKSYPDSNNTAAHSDVQFAIQWDRKDRVLIPEVYVVHLESERVPYGANWKGRKTKPFGPFGEAMMAGKAPQNARANPSGQGY